MLALSGNFKFSANNLTHSTAPRFLLFFPKRILAHSEGKNRYAFAMRKLDMIHMCSPCESICIDGKNKEDGAFRCHLLCFTEWGYWRTDFVGKSPADERRCSYLLRARKRRFSPKYESQDYHSQGTGGVSPAEAVIISSAAVILSSGASYALFIFICTLLLSIT